MKITGFSDKINTRIDFKIIKEEFDMVLSTSRIIEQHLKKFEKEKRGI